MKRRHINKIKKYIEENNLPKLKHIKRKYDLDLSQVLLEGSNTLLHVACDYGYDTIVRYLLKHGCDCMLVNEDGDLPLHLASSFARESDNAYVYQDLLEPLVEASPGSVFVRNNKGIAPNQHLVYIKARSMEQKEETLSDVESQKCPTTDYDFNRRLQEEMENEYYDQWGSYEKYEKDYEFTEASNSCGDWMNRISEDRKRKHKETYAGTKKKKSKTSSKDDQRPQKPGISEEKQKEFEKKLKEIYKDEMASKKNKSIEERVRLKHLYESKCKEIFSRNVHDEIGLLGYRDIPWPHENDKDIKTINEFLFFDMVKDSSEYRKYLRDQQIRWHPDRFLQKCGERLKSRYKEKIVNKVKEISQILNSLSQDISEVK